MEMLAITTCDDLLTDVFGEVGTCADAADGCTCDGPFLAETTIDAAGTWSTSGNDFVFELDGVGAVPGTYCVAANMFLAAVAGSPFINVAVAQAPDDARRIYQQRSAERREFVERETAFKRRDLDVRVNYRKKSGLLSAVDSEYRRMRVEDDDRRRAEIELQRALPMELLAPETAKVTAR